MGVTSKIMLKKKTLWLLAFLFYLLAQMKASFHVKSPVDRQTQRTDAKGMTEACSQQQEAETVGDQFRKKDISPIPHM